MLKFSGYPMAALLASALAMPINANAAPQRAVGAGTAHVGGGGAPHISGAAPHFGGGGAPHFSGASAPHISGRTFAPHIGGRSFTPHFAGRPSGITHFSSHLGGTPHFTARHFARPRIKSHRAVTSNRTLHFTQPNSTARILHGRRNFGRQLANPNISHAQPSLASAPNARSNSHLRHNGTAGITTQAARQGRFASRFAARAQSDPRWRSENIAARRAWQQGRRAGFVAWYGPVFWPYAYSDIFDYAFWPYGYDDGFWDYAYDDFVDGLFWGEMGPPADYVYGYGNSESARAPRVSYAGVQELCKEPGTGITAWPFADIERKVGLNAEQKQLLGDVRKAAADAAATFKASCPSENAFPLTPPGRLTAMTGRLQATLDAVKVVEPALDTFYNSLSDEQKERFNEIGPKRPINNPETTAALPQDSKNCSEAKPGLANLPIEKIEDVVKPTDAQADGLKQLQDATGKAVSLLQAACPEQTPLTPPGRLAAMEKRLQAMIDAANTVKPALEGFYSSLSNEQKARFDRIGLELAQANG